MMNPLFSQLAANATATGAHTAGNPGVNNQAVNNSASAFLQSVTRSDDTKTLRPLNLLLQAAARSFGDYLQYAHDARKRAQLAQECRTLAADIVRLDTDNADALNLLARLALDENAIADAHFLLSRALEKHADNAGCHYSLGHVWLAEKHYTQATESFQQAINIDGNQLRFYTSLAYSLQKQALYADAAHIYRHLRTRHKEDMHINSQLLACLRNLSVTYYDEKLEDDLIDYLEDEKGDLQNLAKPVAELLTHKYLLNDQNSTINFSKIASDELLQAALPRLCFESIAIENLLVVARRNVLEISLYSGEIDTAHENFIHALALHNINHGYIHPQSLAEQAMLDNISTAMHEENLRDSEAAIGELFMLACLYRHPFDVAGDASLHGDKSFWSESARALWQFAQLRSSDDDAVPAMPDSRHTLSLSMRAQYEQAPYPQWQHLHHRTPTRYRDALLAELSGFQPPDFFNTDRLQILVAGCGTGRQAINTAKYFINVDVTAIDLSQNSLRYAQKMARAYQADNVRFYQGDVLDLALEKQFHIVECSGVLHHIEEERLAMEKMLAHLRPDGLLKLGLYSARARAVIQKARDMIQVLGLSTSAQDVRDFRQLILMKARDDEDFRKILHSPDFYSYNGCIDLLFNVYERHYEPLDIQDLLTRHQLRFLGFTGLSEQTCQQYRAQFPQDLQLTNLNNWDIYEQSHPDTFAGMYQFYVTRAVP